MRFTIRLAMAWSIKQLAASPTPQLDASLILAHCLNKDRAYILGHEDDVIDLKQEGCFIDLVGQAAKHVPIPYLIGKAPFYGRDFIVSPDVLIPRPETEELTALALEWLADKQSASVIDVGTGSGCIAVTLACERPDLSVWGVDISEAALSVARENAGIHGVSSGICFQQGDLLAGMKESFDLIVANLPYVGTEEADALPPHVAQHEPAVALFAAEGGTALIRQLLAQALTRLKPNGSIMLEIGYKQGAVAPALAESIFPTAKVMLRQDIAGNDRFLFIQS